MRLNTEERRRLRLMEWLIEQDPGLQSVGPLYEGQPRSFDLSRGDVKHLEADGFVTSYFAGGMLARAEATSDGRAWFDDIRVHRDNKIERRWACRMGLVEWLDHVGAASVRTLAALDGFGGDVRADFYGQPFTADEMDAAAAWLRDRGLIDGISVEELLGPVRAHLTNAGLDCVENCGGDVRRYVSESERARLEGPNIRITAGGHVQFATGSGSNQHIEVNEAAAQIRLEVSGLVEILRALGVADAEELEALYEDAVVGLSGGEPTEEPFHRFSVRARSLAGKTGNIAATAAVSTLVTTLVTNAQHLIAGFH